VLQLDTACEALKEAAERASQKKSGV